MNIIISIFLIIFINFLILLAIPNIFLLLLIPILILLVIFNDRLLKWKRWIWIELFASGKCLSYDTQLFEHLFLCLQTLPS